MSEHGFEIEEVRDLDAAWPELEQLYEGLHRYHETWFGDDMAADWRDRQRAWAEKEAGLVVMGRAQDEAIGFMTALVRENSIRDRRYGLLEHAYVVEEWRNRGVGTEMLQHVEAWVSSQGIDRLELGVAAGNAAGIAAWSALGFETFLHSMGKKVGGHG